MISRQWKEGKKIDGVTERRAWRVGMLPERVTRVADGRWCDTSHEKVTAARFDTRIDFAQSSQTVRVPHLIGTRQRAAFCAIFEWYGNGVSVFHDRKDGRKRGGGKGRRGILFDRDTRDLQNRGRQIFPFNLPVHDLRGTCRSRVYTRTQMQRKCAYSHRVWVTRYIYMSVKARNNARQNDNFLRFILYFDEKSTISSTKRSYLYMRCILLENCFRVLQFHKFNWTFVKTQLTICAQLV